ncbi:FHA domain-containing protein [Tundrisphaera lichenicola]|uniref:FHA domain-containing protein n=1 Tax=Tundrisphaera lichenicola TaxID=2029860 RepID=UPI003EBB7348
MPARLVALDEGSDIPLDRAMVVVGRHPLCDVRLDSLRISRHHCCMTQEKDELVVRDLGSTNGIRINGERVERGRLRTGDELSIAHIRYRLENGVSQEMTQADPNGSSHHGMHAPGVGRSIPGAEAGLLERPLAELLRNELGGIPDKYRIQVIVQMKNDRDPEEETPQSHS